MVTVVLSKIIQPQFPRFFSFSSFFLPTLFKHLFLPTHPPFAVCSWHVPVSLPPSFPLLSLVSHALFFLNHIHFLGNLLFLTSSPIFATSFLTSSSIAATAQVVAVATAVEFRNLNHCFQLIKLLSLLLLLILVLLFHSGQKSHPFSY